MARIVKGVAVALALVALLWAGLEVRDLLQRPTRGELLTATRARAHADARADSLAGTVYVLAEQWAGDAELWNQVEEDLRDRLQKQGAELIQTQRTVGRLREELAGENRVTMDSAGTRTVHVNQRKQYPDGGEVSVAGLVNVPADTARPANVRLEVGARIPLRQTCARLPSGDVRCDASTPIPGFRIDSMATRFNVEGLEPETRPEFGLGLLRQLPAVLQVGTCAVLGGAVGYVTSSPPAGAGTAGGCLFGAGT